jgi:hypothetical protein
MADAASNYFPQTRLLLHFNGDIIDSSPFNHAGVDHSTASDEVDKKFGSASRRFDGGRWIEFPKSDDWSITEDYTIDYWTKFEGDPHMSAAGCSEWSCRCDKSSVEFRSSNGVDVSGGHSMVVGEWHHVEHVVSDGVLAIMVDGVELATAQFPGATINDSPLTIGLGGSDFSNCNLDEFRIVKGKALEFGDGGGGDSTDQEDESKSSFNIGGMLASSSEAAKLTRMTDIAMGYCMICNMPVVAVPIMCSKLSIDMQLPFARFGDACAVSCQHAVGTCHGPCSTFSRDEISMNKMHTNTDMIRWSGGMATMLTSSPKTILKK